MTAVAAQVAVETAPVSTNTHFLLKALRRPAGAVAVAWLAIVVLGAVFAGWLSSDPLQQDLTAVYQTPSAAHWLGTDQLGRDVLSRLLHGGRISLLVTAEAVLVYVVLGVAMGVAAGYLGRWVDRVVMRVVDLLQSMPVIVILLVVLAIFTHNETAGMVTLGVLASAGLARVVRSATMSVRSEAFVSAARVAGLSRWMIIRRHVFPQILGPVLVLGSILAASALLVETALDYLGLGVQAPAPSWGGLVNDASTAIYRQPWLLVPSGGVILVTAVALGVLGDVVRDASADRGAGASALSWRRMRTRVGTAPAAAGATAATTGAVLTVRGLTVQLPARGGPVTIVDRLDLDVAPGEIVGLVGESGSGKTMAISALLRLLPPGGEVSASTLRLGDVDLASLTEKQMSAVRGRRIGFISQEPIGSLDPAFTVGSQLREVIRHHRGVGKAEAHRIAVDLLVSVELPEPESVLRKYPHELSGGLAQRISIARALVGEPDLLIADEPTTALDVTVQAAILDLLRNLCTERGMALLLVTHDWGVVADLCSRAVVMYAGQVVEQAPLRDLFRAPRHPYAAALLAADPGAHEPGERLAAIPGRVVAPGAWPTGCRFADRCPLVTDACRETRVALTTVGASTVRCVHPLSSHPTAAELSVGTDVPTLSKGPVHA